MTYIHDVEFSHPITPERSLELIRANAWDPHFNHSALGLMAILHATAHAGPDRERRAPIPADPDDLQELQTVRFAHTTTENGRVKVTLHML